MIRTAVKIPLISVTLASVSLLVIGCGNSSQTSEVTPAATPAVVDVSPTTSALGAGQTAQFMAEVSGVAASGVTWSVNNVAGGSSTTGTIDSTGLYTAPQISTTTTFTVSAAVASDTTGSASVMVMAPGVVAATQNPQVALYSFSAPAGASVQIEFGTDTSYGLTTNSLPAPPGGGEVYSLVAGMRSFTSYHMRAMVELSGGTQYLDSDRTFTTGGLPASQLPMFTVAQAAGPQTNPGVEMWDLASLSGAPGGPVEALVTDLDGNVIWYYTFDNSGDGIPFPIKPLSNGHFKIAIGSVYPFVYGEPLNVVREIDLAGNTISELTLPEVNAGLAALGSNIVAQGFHHDFALLPTGHTVYLVSDVRNGVIGDALVDVDENNVVRWAWSTFDHLDINYRPFGFPDWTHCNAIIYSSTDGNLVLSSRSLSWVMKIDYRFGVGAGDILWKLGPNGDITLENGGPGGWFYNQHFPVFLSPNTVGTFKLGVWDNGNSRPDLITGIPCGDGGDPGGVGPCYSRGLIFEINEPAKTAQIVWQDDVSPEFATCCGDINVLSNGDVEMGMGATGIFPATSQTREVTQEPTPVTVWQMNLTGQFAYRSFRIPSLYPGITW